MKLRLLDGATHKVLEPAPTLNGDFRELTEAQFIAPAGDGWVLRIDDEPLASNGAGWLWKPGFFAGTVVAELQGPQGISRWLLDVSPDPQKLGREVFASMLGELLDEEPTLVFGEQPSTSTLLNGALALDHELAALVALSRLKTWAPPLMQAITLIERQPRQELRRERRTVPAHRAKQIDANALLRLVRSPHLVRAAETSPQKFALTRSAQLEITSTKPTLDAAANRAIVQLLKRVVQRADETGRALARSAERATDIELKSARFARLPTRLQFLEGLRERIERRLRAPPWKDVSRVDDAAAGLNTLSADPSYAQAATLAFATLRTGLSAGTSDERMSLSPTWEIFERWCFVRIAQQLRARWPELEWKRSEAPNTTAMWRGSGQGIELRLLLQPRFRAWDLSEHNEFRSLSREREPDLVLTARFPHGARWLALDAKYRVRRPNVLEAMESAHIYRDSLRWNGHPSVGSFLLLPAAGECDWLSTPEFHREQRLGTIAFSGELPDMLLPPFSQLVPA